ncbi:MAG: ABC transporter permease [Candidatus Krumholzibacteriia bacterium]
MSKVLTIIRKEYLERVRSKSFVIGTLLGPAFMSMFVVLPVLLATSGGDDARTIGVVDGGGGVLDRIEEVFAEEGRTSVTLVPFGRPGASTEASVEDLRAAVQAEEIDAGVVLDSDFIGTGKVAFYGKSVSAMVMRDDVLRPALNRILREIRFAEAAVPDSLFTYLSARTDWATFTVTAAGSEEQQNEEAAFIAAFALIMIIYIMVLMYGNHTLTAVIEEKSSRMVEVLLASVSPGNLMLGKVMGIGLAGLTQFGVWTLAFFLMSQQGVSVGSFSLDVHFLTPTILVSFVMFFLLGFFLYATLYAGIGAMCNSVQDSQQFQGPLTMGLVLPMLLLSLVLRAPDSTLSVVLSMIPLFAPVLMFMRVCIETPPLWQILLSWALLAVSIWLSARVAGKLFRMGILMYGASPTWAGLRKVLRDR